MSGPDKVLLIDVGNTQIKWTWANPQGDIAVSTLQDASALSQNINQARKVLVASVGHKLIVSQIKSLCESHSTVFKQILTQKSSFGLQCAYANHTKLGVDRWLGILGASLLSKPSFAVIDIGTAMTCDFVVDNKHLGGWISPGFSLMRSSVSSQTQQVSSDNQFPTALSFGVDTEECVNMGCLVAIQGQVQMALNHLTKLSDDPHIFISGGGQKLVNELKLVNVRFFPNLVLLGLQRFIDYEGL